jgi:hypothetical protein
LTVLVYAPGASATGCPLVVTSPVSAIFSVSRSASLTVR